MVVAPRISISSARSWARIACLGSAAAAAIHFGAVHEHLMEWALAAAFMLGSGLLQAAWALAVLNGAPRSVVQAGAAGNAATVGLWIVSRTAGLPFGPERGMREHVGAPDLLATACEILVVAAALQILRANASKPRPWLWRFAIAATIVTPLAATAAEQPLRDCAVAAVALGLVFLVHAIAPHVRDLIPRPSWRSDVEVPHLRLGSVGLHERPRPVVGARG